jgi:hypothetical protein
MTPEERISRIENQIGKQNEGIQGLIVVARTVLTSIQELRGIQDKAIEESRELHKTMTAEVRDLHKHTDEKLNILIDTVDRIIRNRNGQK